MRLLTILAVLLTATVAAPANAVICYTLLDREDSVVYRSSAPPVDMSEAGAAQRDALRRSNQYLMVTEVDSCPAVATAGGASGYRAATVDEIVAEMRSYLSYGGTSGASSRAGSSEGGLLGAPASAGGSSSARTP